MRVVSVKYLLPLRDKYVCISLVSAVIAPLSYVVRCLPKLPTILCGYQVHCIIVMIINNADVWFVYVFHFPGVQFLVRKCAGFHSRRAI